MDALRKESYRRADSLDAAPSEDGAPLGERLPSGAALPDRGAHNAALRPLIERALSSLPPEQREVFLLREYHGVPFKEIAQVTGVPENTVKSRMRYALESLRRRLQELGVDGDMAGESPVQSAG